MTRIEFNIEIKKRIKSISEIIIDVIENTGADIEKDIIKSIKEEFSDYDNKIEEIKNDVDELIDNLFNDLPHIHELHSDDYCEECDQCYEEYKETRMEIEHSFYDYSHSR